MGGWGSGRQGSTATADASRRIDLAWMIRKGLAKPGRYSSGTLSWTCGDRPSGSISFEADMRDEDAGELRLSYTRGEGSDAEKVKQTVRLTYTEPNYGGRRWWMICPYRHNRVAKLYLPPNGDRFAGRQAWRLGYSCQRVSHRDRAFEKLFRLQKKLGCRQGWEQPIHRPKGMWNRTYDRLESQYWQLDGECGAAMMGVVLSLRQKLKKA